MDICIECKLEKTKTILRCCDCDEKLKTKIKIKKQMRDNWNWPFDRNENISKQQIRNHN